MYQTVPSSYVSFCRGKTSYDLLVNLFKGYAANPDRHIRAYLARKKDSYDEGGSITPGSLMEDMLNKYKDLVEDRAFREPTESDKQIVALQATTDKLKKKCIELSKSLKRKIDNNSSDSVENAGSQ